MCDTAYTKVKTDLEGEANKIKYKEDVEKFCAIIGEEKLSLGN